eukprot:TRINITY_DN27265_c0_g1_i1.p1 TRINITY_DN27265_c0_g1~~TRINITY_DN27265_c0_g1_i1.p1  ORF type:complete len:1044 (-),score=154.05 TRINITY_DN27265_c0_g1_i1:51-3182(-)
MVEMLMAGGKMSKELFDYNRDVFKFDQMQRLQRDILKMEMQISRFELFREDIRDLVELTVGKMEMYHLVGALFMEFCIAFYVEGKIETLSVPCFSLSLYYISVAGAFLYLLITVWLSMYASISSHAFGVRLLCRYVRLPLPGEEKMRGITNKLAEYEQDAKGMFRVPFLQKARAVEEKFTTDSLRTGGKDYLGQGELPFIGGEEAMLRRCSATFAREHVTLFRRLQAKWQCFDAYARVSMCIGASHILSSICFYMVNVTMVTYRSPTTCYTVMAVFQTCALLLAFLDISGARRWQVAVMQSFCTMPCILAASFLTWVYDDVNFEASGRENVAGMKFTFAPICFFLEAMWLEGMLWVASPSKDEATLPRRFRAVLFLDVFGDANYDPVTAESINGADDTAGGSQGLANRSRALEGRLRAEDVMNADDACELAHQALRRWESVPDNALPTEQRAELRRLRRELKVWRGTLRDEVRFHIRSDPTFEGADDLLRDDDRSFAELSSVDIEEDAFRGRPVGPVQVREQKTGRVAQCVWQPEGSRMQGAGGQDALTLQETAGFLVDAGAKVRGVVSHERASNASEKISGEFTDESDSEFDEASTRRCCCIRRAPAPTGVSLYVPQRLPWKVLKWATRLFQLVWLFQGTMFALEDHKYFSVDHPRRNKEHEGGEHEHGGGEHEHGIDGEEPLTARRLGSFQWRMETVDAPWLQDNLIAPDDMYCSASAVDGSGSTVLISNANYAGGRSVHTLKQDIAEGTRLQMRHAASHDSLTHEAFICGPSSAGAPFDRCLFAQPVEGGVEFWPAENADASDRKLRISFEEGIDTQKVWRLVTGAQVPCHSFEDLFLGEEAPKQDAWCLLYAASDGGSAVDVGLAKLRGGLGSLPIDNEPIIPAFSLPLSSPSREAVGVSSAAAIGVDGSAPVALHLEANSGRGRLWALLEDDSLVAWDLSVPRSLGRWSLSRAWPKESQREKAVGGVGAFRATDLCEGVLRRSRPAGSPSSSNETTSAAKDSNVLFFVGVGGNGRPAMLQATIPEGLDGTFRAREVLT